eukprot:CAMPEP_0172423532 /NCGR_PEP_ID=MMETSP1064-20121228/17223_1 /TAXON_ID=202472 /ORGANISM="Aulacoseira subarctica , Strain CCAP 1002/5" /LENGTH=315 /DNA_ID=CAMNT_0013164949 /DNA_START=63 /DNA_END=1010 /DNA_ORIENTATION=-
MSAIARSQRIKAEAFLADAEKTLKKTTWFASSAEAKHEQAAELYEKAANAFKVGQFFMEAGQAYVKTAEIHRDKLNSLGEASKSLSNAGSCFKRCSPSDAIETYRSAVTLLCDAGRLTQAAKLSKEIAELYENEADTDSTVLAIENYEQASELFGMENSNSQQSQCLSKVAELCSAQLNPPDLLRAAQIYDDLGRQCLDSNLLKYNAKGYFLQSIFCHLANGDSIAARQAHAKYGNLDFTFTESREGKLCAALVECMEQFDSEGFATACFEYDRISKLDPWKTTLLVKVKRSIEDQAGGEALGGNAMDGDDVDLT